MKALYHNDKSKGPGYGFLEISDASQLSNLEGVTFGIKRASDQKSLGKSGWQPAETPLSPGGLSLTDEGYALAVGPDVVDHLDTQETYRLSLTCADGTVLVGSLRVPEITYSAQDGGQGIAATQFAPPPPPPPPAPAPAPEPAPEPEPQPCMRTDPLPPEPRKGSLLPLVLIGLVLVLAGGGFAAWKFLLDKNDAPPSAEAPETRPPLTLAREHLAGAADPAESLKLARELQERENAADASFLLAEDAAQKGNADAMLLTGGFYDPAEKSPSGSIAKDAAQALAWYRKARAAGHADAQARLDALRVWLDAEAAGGSREAKELLEHFEDVAR